MCEELEVFSKLGFGQFCVVLLLTVVAAGTAVPKARAEDDVEVFRVYSWSSFETADPETSSNCRAIDKGKNERGWAVARREVADVSDLELPDEQKQGTAFRVFVDYCVHLGAKRERPVGAMTFRTAPLDDLRNIQRWGSRQYRTTARASKRAPKPGREHFNPPNFKRNK